MCEQGVTLLALLAKTGYHSNSWDIFCEDKDPSASMRFCMDAHWFRIIYIYTVLYSIYIFRTAWTTEYLERTPGSRGPMLMRRRYNYWELKWIWKVENTSIVKIGMQIGECLASVDVQRIFWRLLRISWLGMVYDCVKCRVKAKCIAAKQTQERLPLWHIYICLLWGDPRRS